MRSNKNSVVSLVIPTYNGKEKVWRLLKELSKQSFKQFETIVVIDGSTDGTKAALQAATWDLTSLRIIDQPNSGRAGARNAGAKAALTDILLFIDDDMVPAPTLVEEHLKAQEQHNIVVGILDSYKEGSDPELLEFSYYMNRKMNTDIFETSGEIRETPYITANNFSIKRRLFETLKGFDGRLNDAEDFELAVRCKEQGYNIFYSNKCLAYHTLPPSLQWSAKRNKEYRNARKELLKYHPKIGQYFSNTENALSVYKRPFFYLFSFELWLKLADKKIFKVLPKVVRFKLYDIMLTANYYF